MDICICRRKRRINTFFLANKYLSVDIFSQDLCIYRNRKTELFSFIIVTNRSIKIFQSDLTMLLKKILE